MALRILEATLISDVAGLKLESEALMRPAPSAHLLGAPWTGNVAGETPVSPMGMMSPRFLSANIVLAGSRQRRLPASAPN